MDPSMPRKFFEQHLRPNYEEWLRHPVDQRLAKNAAQDANNMAARVLHYWKDLDPSQIYETKNETSYRAELVKRECPDFAWVRDVAEAYKHVALTRRPETRIVTRYDQTVVKDSRWDDAVWDETAWDGELMVTGNDGNSRPLADIMQNVMAMWERLLDRMML